MFDPWCPGATCCVLAAVHNVAENKIDYKRFICFGINRAGAGEQQNTKELRDRGSGCEAGNVPACRPSWKCAIIPF
jgi:hypothetical protein